MNRLAGIATILLLALSVPAVCQAEDEGPSIASYGIDGFWSGALIGLATGYLTTLDEFDSDDWKNLAFGAGIGALSGVGFGLALGIVDAGEPHPALGWYVLRDVGYGITLGALTGTAVGALFMIDSGRPKDLLIGASAGALVGTVAGVLFGIIEGTSDGKDKDKKAARGAPRLRFALLAAEGAVVPVPGVAGHF